MKETKTVYIGLGSNLGKREMYLSFALKAIEKIAVITKRSSVYETEPKGYKNQGNFLNMVIEIETRLNPRALLQKLQKIENELGRERLIRFGPRTIDLDILLYEDCALNAPDLVIPHPRMDKRDFVLKPLKEIAPDKWKQIKPEVVLIDNYDSFTYNLYQQIESLGKKVKIFKNDEISVEKLKKLMPEKIIISPGPKRPKDSGISMGVIKHFYAKVPILGVCLGHQAIGSAFGSSVVYANDIVHGKTSRIFHAGADIFKGISMPFEAARYHSLIVKEVPNDFELLAWTEDNQIMAMRHKNYPVYGFQFHPESFMTRQGDVIMRRFLYET